MVEAFLSITQAQIYIENCVLDKKPKKQKRKSSNLKKWVSNIHREQRDLKIYTENGVTQRCVRTARPSGNVT